MLRIGMVRIAGLVGQVGPGAPEDSGWAKHAELQGWRADFGRRRFSAVAGRVHRGMTDPHPCRLGIARGLIVVFE